MFKMVTKGIFRMRRSAVQTLKPFVIFCEGDKTQGGDAAAVVDDSEEEEETLDNGKSCACCGKRKKVLSLVKRKYYCTMCRGDVFGEEPKSVHDVVRLDNFVSNEEEISVLRRLLMIRSDLTPTFATHKGHNVIDLLRHFLASMMNGSAILRHELVEIMSCTIEEIVPVNAEGNNVETSTTKHELLHMMKPRGKESYNLTQLFHHYLHERFMKTKATDRRLLTAPKVLLLAVKVLDDDGAKLQVGPCQFDEHLNFKTAHDGREQHYDLKRIIALRGEGVEEGEYVSYCLKDDCWWLVENHRVLPVVFPCRLGKDEDPVICVYCKKEEETEEDSMSEEQERALLCQLNERVSVGRTATGEEEEDAIIVGEDDGACGGDGNLGEDDDDDEAVRCNSESVMQTA